MLVDQQIILACDDDGNFTGEYIPKEVGHTGEGQRHLAITVLIYNNKGQVLLQKRKHLVFDDIWDFTGATHPLHKENGSDESYEEATLRCLKREYDIDSIPLKNLGAFNYFSKYNGLCENEYCYLLIGQYDGGFKLNEEVGYGYKWMDKDEFLKDIKANLTNYSPWAVAGIPLLEKDHLFD